MGSAYSVRGYVVDPHLGGAEDLAAARPELGRRGMRLILDLCRNVSRRTTYREYFIRGSLEDLRDDPAAFVLIESRAFAYGRVPTPALPEDIYGLVFGNGVRTGPSSRSI